MKPLLTALTLVLVIAFSSCATRTASQSENVPVYQGAVPVTTGRAPEVAPPDSGWPRVFISGTTTNIVYQPQIDSWDGHTITARNAVAVQSAGQPQPIYGVITVKATTLVDKTARTVSFEEIQILSADFPSAPDRAPAYLRELREQFPKYSRGVSLDRLEASLAVSEQQQKAQAQPLKNTPPKIIVSTNSAVLVYIDGQPAYRAVPGTDLQRVVNTRLLLLKDGAGRHYLHLLNSYMEAPTLDGPWTVASQPPPNATEAEKQARDSMQVDLLEGQPDPLTKQIPLLGSGTAPTIYLATTPTELITFSGEPNFVPIPGTQLLYATNTSGNVFKLLTDQQTYLLISGRWFRAPSFGGSWQFVPANQLPQDFAQIPDTNPKENVKASVAGTPQAHEALIANSIPESTKVQRNTPMEDAQIDGPPQLQPIEGTPLYYVFNSSTPIIKVDDHSWYACQNGVWFVATSVNGPWTVAAAVPAVIYSIPPSSPLHYVTYVRVYNATPEYVHVGYTPGYLGAVIAPEGVVVYGTGYYYRPWIGTVWYGPPITWGLGCDLAWTPWAGWYFGFGFGWDWGFGGVGWWRWHPPAPWWGPYRHWPHHGAHRIAAWGPGGWANTAGDVYHRRGAPRYNAFAGNEWAHTYGRAYNSRTGALAAGQHGRVQNVYSGNYLGRPISSLPPMRAPTGKMAGPGNNAFATPEGRVYFHDGNTPSAGWRSATPPPRVEPRAPTPTLGRESAARSLGEQRYNGFRASQPPGGFNAGRPAQGPVAAPRGSGASGAFGHGGSRGGRGGGHR